MSIEGQGHFFTIYFPGFVCFLLYWAKISGERLQDHWSSCLVYYIDQFPRHRLQLFPRNPSLSHFPIGSGYFARAYTISVYDSLRLAVKWVMVNTGSTFEQTTMGPGSLCYKPKFMEICPLVPDKKIFKAFYHILQIG